MVSYITSSQILLFFWFDVKAIRFRYGSSERLGLFTARWSPPHQRFLRPQKRRGHVLHEFGFATVVYGALNTSWYT